MSVMVANGGRSSKGTALQANKHQTTLRTKMTQAAMTVRAQDVCTRVRNTRANRAQADMGTNVCICKNKMTTSSMLQTDVSNNHYTHCPMGVPTSSEKATKLILSLNLRQC